MTEPQKVTPEAEILSRLLDELNAGQQPKSDDTETAELLEIAALIKKAGPVVRPPQHLLDQTVDKILADQPARPIKQPKQFWSWLKPGVLGAAASLLLVVGLQLYPSWNSSEVQTVTAPVPVVEKREAAPAKQAAEKMAAVPTAPVSAEALPAAAPEKTAERAQEAAPFILNNGNSLTSPAAIAVPETAKKAPALFEQAPVKAEKAPLVTEKYSSNTESGSVYKAAAFPLDEPSERWPLPILSLPGQAPDEISSDKKTGAVRQVFWKGTPQEVIVTQRRVRLEETAAQAAPIIKPEAGGEKAGTLNSVTLILHGQEVTVEGYRTGQELTKIAKQLTSP